MFKSTIHYQPGPAEPNAAPGASPPPPPPPPPTPPGPPAPGPQAGAGDRNVEYATGQPAPGTLGAGGQAPPLWPGSRPAGAGDPDQPPPGGTHDKPERDDQQRLTRPGMEAVIKGGGSVIYKGQVRDKIEQLPSDAEMAEGDPAATARAVQELDRAQAALDARRDRLTNQLSTSAPSKPAPAASAGPGNRPRANK